MWYELVKVDRPGCFCLVSERDAAVRRWFPNTVVTSLSVLARAN